MPYPQNVYSVTAEDDNTITVRTTNKKYFKKIIVPDLERAGLKVEQDRISFTHQFNTLIITVWKMSKHFNTFRVLLCLFLLFSFFFSCSTKNRPRFWNWKERYWMKYYNWKQEKMATYSVQQANKNRSFWNQFSFLFAYSHARKMDVWRKWS